MGASSSLRSLEPPYRWAGTEGLVRVELGPNDDPAALGCAPYARGLPYCRATVEPLPRGYADALGWVLLTDHTARGPGFEVDPFAPLGEVDHPFAFFGFAPRQFDLRAVTGFSWGFEKRGAEASFVGLHPLGPTDWESHREHLRRARPRWKVAPGFSVHPFGR